MKFNIKFLFPIFILTVLMLHACSTTKFVPDGQYLLTDATIKSDAKGVSAWELRGHIKQKPNFRTLEIFKVPLTIYNLSGNDSTRWINKTLRRAGEPPIIYDSTKVTETITNLERIMMNKGYLQAVITPEISLKKKKARITYKIKSGDPYLVNNYTIHIPDSVIRNYDSISYLPPKIKKKRLKDKGNLLFNTDTLLMHGSDINKGSHFDLDALDKERERITYRLRRSGYYAMNKGHIGFVADTTVGVNRVDLELDVMPFKQVSNSRDTVQTSHLQYTVGRVEIYVDYNPIEIGSVKNYIASSSFSKDGYSIHYGERGKYIRASKILDKCFIQPYSVYDEDMTVQTYTAMNQLGILKNINISFNEYIEDGKPMLHCIITCIPDKRQGMSTELEGTHSGGFFGIGAGLGYKHKNIFKGSEEFNAKIKGSYEAITPQFNKFSENYFELGASASLTYPLFMFPFVSKEFKKKRHASTQFNADYSIQRRPKFFYRTVMSTGVKYIWNERKGSPYRHTFDLIDINYIRVPQNKLDSAFAADLTPSARHYSFSDQFIMSMGYTFTKTNRLIDKSKLKPIYSLRGSIETAGNVLALTAKLTNASKTDIGSRKLFGTPFAQYVRATTDYSKTYFFDEKNSFAWHVGGGIAMPYGNFKQIPIQKRFFSGGANNVRGWAVRELGPGTFYPKDKINKTDDTFYNHSGEIRFDANIEYRSKLFWILELGTFIDAGNVWTTKEYKDQEGGKFAYNKFYKEIAVAWGVGLRLDFDFILVRLDCGWKAYNPSGDPSIDKWPIKAPHKLGQNTAWHIGVGYPF